MSNYVYSNPSRESDTYSLPDVEIFEVGENEREDTAPGWYYWFCFPGCMPDSDPFGPYETEQEAEDAMRDEHGPNE